MARSSRKQFLPDAPLAGEEGVIELLTRRLVGAPYQLDGLGRALVQPDFLIALVRHDQRAQCVATARMIPTAEVRELRRLMRLLDEEQRRVLNLIK